MNWIQLRFTCPATQTESFEELLMETEAVSVTFQDAEDQPILEPGVGQTPLWDIVTVVALYVEDSDIDTILMQIKAAKPDFNLDQLHIETIPDQNWVNAWIADFKPMQFGENLWICPSAHQPVDPNAVNVLLDPGLAFGTGTHPTTAMCLQWLSKQDLQDKTIIDFGCGSGILGIAAVMLGAKQAICIDNDPQAITATRYNAEQNSLTDSQILAYLPEQFTALQADIMVANILAGPLIELAPYLASLTKTEGRIALSGILEVQAQSVLDRYAEFFTMDLPVHQNEWVSLSGKKL
ncbi:MAG: 50S ribosomal protein L11 methyltransferase [Gammaproteobacteria bacterium]|nr:50S ribosomal protein L11 methyltransferase [Gammaproteobacteria bacterium]